MVWPFDNHHHLSFDEDLIDSQNNGDDHLFDHAQTHSDSVLDSNLHPMDHSALEDHHFPVTEINPSPLSITEHLLHEYLGNSGNGYIDIGDGTGGRPRNNDGWASDLADHMTTQGVDMQAHESVLPSQLLGDLIQGKEVILPSHLDHHSGNSSLDELVHNFGGKVVRAEGFDLSDEQNPQVLLSDHLSKGDTPTPYPLEDFIQKQEDVSLSYASTTNHAANITEFADGFNHEVGFFDQAMDWIQDHAPQIASAFAGAAVGDVMGDVLGSDFASVIGHYATEKTINHTLDLDHKDSTASDGVKFGVALMDDNMRDDFLDKL